MVTIRPMASSDLDEVAQIESEIYDYDIWTRESFQEEVELKKHAHCFVLTDNEVIAGYIVVWFYAGELHIGNVGIGSAFRRKGLGKELIRFILAHFPEAESAYLEVKKTNSPAIRLYEQFGFSALMERRAYYNDGSDALVMVKNMTL